MAIAFGVGISIIIAYSVSLFIILHKKEHISEEDKKEHIEMNKFIEDCCKFEIYNFKLNDDGFAFDRYDEAIHPDKTIITFWKDVPSKTAPKMVDFTLGIEYNSKHNSFVGICNDKRYKLNDKYSNLRLNPDRKIEHLIITYWNFLLKHYVIIPDGDDYLIWSGNVGCGRPYK
jgi:hypothetical protein